MEIDHQPPKIFFVEKSSPALLRFPSCLACNRNSSFIDQVFAFYARMDPLGEFSLDSKQLDRAVKALHEQYPTLKPFFIPTNEKRRSLRELGLSLRKGQTYANAPVLGFNPNVLEVVGLSIAKQAVAIYYLNRKQPVPVNSGITVITERDIHSKSPSQLDVLGLDPGLLWKVKNPNNNAEKQLSFGTQYNQEEALFAVHLRYGLSFFSTVAIHLGREDALNDFIVKADPFPWGFDLETVLRGKPNYVYYEQNS